MTHISSALLRAHRWAKYLLVLTLTFGMCQELLAATANCETRTIGALRAPAKKADSYLVKDERCGSQNAVAITLTPADKGRQIIRLDDASVPAQEHWLKIKKAVYLLLWVDDETSLALVTVDSSGRVVILALGRDPVWSRSDSNTVQSIVIFSDLSQNELRLLGQKIANGEHREAFASYLDRGFSGIHFAAIPDEDGVLDLATGHSAETILAPLISLAMKRLLDMKARQLPDIDKINAAAFFKFHLLQFGDSATGAARWRQVVDVLELDKSIVQWFDRNEKVFLAIIEEKKRSMKHAIE